MLSAKTDRILRLAAAVLTIALVYVIITSIHERVVSAGDSAPSFTIATEGGRTVSLSDFGGKVLILNFWATWCPPCVEETPSLSEIATRLNGRGVVVLGVSVDRDEKLYRNFLQQFRPTFLTARDPEQKINSDYGTNKYPETYIIKEGRVVQKIIGPTNWSDPQMVSYIESLL